MQRSLLHQQLRAAARTDAKTGLLNASAWQREAGAEITRALRGGGPLALLLVDIDHFKRVNDMHGHLVGDRVLHQLADELGHEVRDSDVLGRFGGEEFVVLLPGSDADEACRAAERLRVRAAAITVPADGTRIGQLGYGFPRPGPAGAGSGPAGNGGGPEAVAEHEPGAGAEGIAPWGDTASPPARAAVNVTISIGIAMLRTHGRDLLELLAAADLALYRAKDSGRDQVRMFVPCEREPGGDSADEGGQPEPAAP
jgi:diguanylate cyclase (GGDEF)-like protein